MTSRLLVILQLVALLGLTYFSSIPGLSLFPDTISFIGILIGVWAVFEMTSSGKYSIMPEVSKGATLVTSGPYALIRHPMYAALLIFAVGRVLNNIHLSTVFFALLLLFVLKEKMDREEEYLLKAFPRYSAYIKTTKRIIPGLY